MRRVSVCCPSALWLRRSQNGPSAAAERLKEDLGGGVPSRLLGALDPLAEGRRRLPLADFDRERAAGRAMEIDPAIEQAVAPVPSVRETG